MSSNGQAHETSHTDQQPNGALEAQKPEGRTKPDSEGMSIKKFEPIRFLVAEDHPLIRKVITKQMDELGHDCDFVVNGKEALEAYKKGYQVYQCTLMDVSMPVMGGIDATKLIRAFEDESNLNPGYIVALTAGMFETEGPRRDRMRELGFTTTLRRPFRTADLNSLLEELGLLREV